MVCCLVYYVIYCVLSKVMMCDAINGVLSKVMMYDVIYGVLSDVMMYDLGKQP